MQIGMIGLGKMGYQLSLNLVDKEYDVVAFDANHESMKKISSMGVQTADSINQLVSNLSKPRTVWMMVPAGDATQSVFEQLLPFLEEGDRIIDGGNAHYKDSLKRNEKCEEKGIYFFDCGTSGGVDGARNGACTMIGGNEEVFKEIEPIFKDITVENGYLYSGKAGSGHFLKMVHNGIEYGMMQSIAEGFELMHESEYKFDNAAVARLWNNGSVIRCWLMELMHDAFSKDAELEAIKGVMHSSGEAKWMLETALDKNVATPVVALSLLMRYRSLKEDTFSGKVVAALRNEFGGHAVEAAQKPQ